MDPSPKTKNKTHWTQFPGGAKKLQIAIAKRRKTHKLTVAMKVSSLKVHPESYSLEKVAEPLLNKMWGKLNTLTKARVLSTLYN